MDPMMLIGRVTKVEFPDMCSGVWFRAIEVNYYIICRKFLAAIIGIQGFSLGVLGCPTDALGACVNDLLRTGACQVTSTRQNCFEEPGSVFSRV
jgi:hypothetical protein